MSRRRAKRRAARSGVPRFATPVDFAPSNRRINYVKALVVGGTPSAGKSRTILWLTSVHEGLGRVGVAKLDCLRTTDDTLFRSRGIPATRLLAGRFCPDHAWMERLPEVREWALARELETLLVETAGLCARCAPYLDDALALCVLDCTGGIHGPSKLGPLLADADVCVLTKGDLVSQAEREVFSLNVRSKNPRAALVTLNGLTGEGSRDLVRALDSLSWGRLSADVAESAPRTPLPQMYCSYCFGRSEVGITSL